MILDDPAVQRDHVTFCVWYLSDRWNVGNVNFPNQEDDGSSCLLGTIRKDAKSYTQWATSYYDRDLDVTLVESVYAGSPITDALVAQLNPDRDVRQALAGLRGRETDALGPQQGGHRMRLSGPSGPSGDHPGHIRGDYS